LGPTEIDMEEEKNFLYPACGPPQVLRRQGREKNHCGHPRPTHAKSKVEVTI